MKNIAVLLGLLLCFCASSWGACMTGNTSVFRDCHNCPSNPNSVTCNGYISYTLTGSFCGSLPVSSDRCDYDYICCDTQAEADSATIAQKCATGTMVKDTVGATIFDACQNGEGLLIAFNNPITGVHNASIGYYIVTDDSADSLDEATYNHLASLACTEVSLYRGVLNGKYVYWYSTDPEPAGVVNVVRIK